MSHISLRMNQTPFYVENNSQTNCTRNTVKYSTALYFCKAVPNATLFSVVFDVYANYFILKFNKTEFDEKL